MLSSEIIKNTDYIVEEIMATDEVVASRFYKLGIYPGVEIQLIRKAPIFGDPLLFNVAGCQIALTKYEASQLKVCAKGDLACH